jgi:hypothetical protein
VWFGVDRHLQAEGRAAARRARNPIRLIPTTKDVDYAFEEVCIVTVRGAGVPLHKVNLARGSRQLIVAPDESVIDIEAEDWHRFGKGVKFVHLDLPRREFTYRYRLITSIALAEIARQVGQRARPPIGRPKRQVPFYDSSLAVRAEVAGEVVFLDNLVCY